MQRSLLTYSRFVALALAASWLPAAAAGQSTPPDPSSDARGAERATPTAGTPGHDERAPLLRAIALSGEIELDGRLDEPFWAQAPIATDFVQREPNEGLPATQRTEVRFVYSGETLYVGARMFDERGADGVVSRLVRRDADTQSDLIEVSFDTFHDHLGRTSFSVNPAGVRGDAINGDESWDPVWRTRARVDSLGWTAELAIPFSQLRFRTGQDQEWGLQITRRVNRLNEVSTWSFWNLNVQGGPSRYGHLTGIGAPRASTNRLEILPYAVSQLDVSGTVDRSNPFRSRTEPTQRIGADVKYLLSSNLTLTATINPDFGQAEVDPAVVNLSAFETFFPEKREFFIEGRNRFGFGNFWCYFCSNTSSLSMLFTRRIGRSPQGAGLANSAGEFSDVPSNSTILGAAKVTGRTPGGTSIGILGALTQREYADVQGFDQSLFRQEVEPAAGYFVGRVKQDLLDGDLQVGAILTSLYRDFDDPALESRLNRHSEGLGLDAEYWWGDRTYHMLFQTAFTNNSGDADAILRQQTSSARYFQRPDRQNGSNGLFSDAFDPNLTALRGWALYSRIAKDGGDWQWEAATNIRSPGFENNDIAFLSRADLIWMVANLRRSWTVPTSWYRQLSFTAGAQQQFNFDGDLTSRQLHGSVFVETPFYWNISAFGIFRPSTLDDRLTRGGPLVRAAENAFVAGFISTDQRRPVIFSLEPSFGWSEERERNLSIGAGITFKPASNINLRLGPRYSRSTSRDQFVSSVTDPTATAFFGSRYLFADLDRESLSMNTRLNVTFTPNMSLEVFAQPLLSANDFSAFKEFVAPRGLAKQVFGRDVGTIRSEGEGFDERFFIDPDGGGAAEEFSIRDPDFNFRSLRGNLVFRWEYLPGSTLFLVWTQDRNAVDPFGDLNFDRDTDALFGADTDNVFLLKLTYWLGF